MAEEPRIVEMQEDDWISPEDMRLRAEERARLQAEEDEAARLSGRAPRKGAAASAASASAPFVLGEWSTALSDAALVASALYGCWLLTGHEGFSPYRARYSLLVAVAGLLVTALAALCGSLRFAGLAFLARPHDWLTVLATAAGVPLLAAGALLAGELPLSAHRFNALLPLGAAVAAAAAMRGWGRALAGPLSSAGGAVLALKGAALLAAGPRGGGAAAGLELLAGVALAVVASRFVAPAARDRRHGPLRMLGVDVFHYLFAVAVLCFAHGIAAATSAGQPPALLVLAWIPGFQ